MLTLNMWAVLTMILSHIVSWCHHVCSAQCLVNECHCLLCLAWWGEYDCLVTNCCPSANSSISGLYCPPPVSYVSITVSQSRLWINIWARTYSNVTRTQPGSRLTSKDECCAFWQAELGQNQQADHSQTDRFLLAGTHEQVSPPMTGCNCLSLSLV